MKHNYADRENKTGKTKTGSKKHTSTIFCERRITQINFNNHRVGSSLSDVPF